MWNLIYHIFIVNAWGIVLLTLFYAWTFKKMFPKLRQFTPIFCIIFGLIFILSIPGVDGPSTDRVIKISDIIYDILAPIGIYELGNCIYLYIKDKKESKK